MPNPLIYVGLEGKQYALLIGTDTYIFLPEIPALPIYIGMDNWVLVDELQDPSALVPTYNNVEADLTAKLLTENGVELWSGTLAYVATSDGRYKVGIPDSVTRKLGKDFRYKLIIDDPDKIIYAEIWLVAKFFGPSKITVATP